MQHAGPGGPQASGQQEMGGGRHLGVVLWKGVCVCVCVCQGACVGMKGQKGQHGCL